MTPLLGCRNANTCKSCSRDLLLKHPRGGLQSKLNWMCGTFLYTIHMCECESLDDSHLLWIHDSRASCLLQRLEVSRPLSVMHDMMIIIMQCHHKHNIIIVKHHRTSSYSSYASSYIIHHNSSSRNHKHKA